MAESPYFVRPEQFIWLKCSTGICREKSACVQAPHDYLVLHKHYIKITLFVYFSFRNELTFGGKIVSPRSLFN